MLTNKNLYEGGGHPLISKSTLKAARNQKIPRLIKSIWINLFESSSIVHARKVTQNTVPKSVHQYGIPQNTTANNPPHFWFPRSLSRSCGREALMWDRWSGTQKVDDRMTKTIDSQPPKETWNDCYEFPLLVRMFDISIWDDLVQVQKFIGS
jgi:hypothetical protein